MVITQEFWTAFIDHKVNLLNVNMGQINDIESCLDGSCGCTKVISMDSIVVPNKETTTLSIKILKDEIDLCVHAVNIATTLNDLKWARGQLSNL